MFFIMKKENVLSTRLLKFSVDIIKFTRSLPKEPEYNIIKYQLIKSATSAGANYEEAQSASSKADFKNKVNSKLDVMMNLLRDRAQLLSVNNLLSGDVQSRLSSGP